MEIIMVRKKYRLLPDTALEVVLLDELVEQGLAVKKVESELGLGIGNTYEYIVNLQKVEGD